MNNFYSEIKKPIHDLYSHCYISLKNSYVFHSVGKAANSSVKYWLYREEAKGTRFKYENVHDRRQSPLISPFQLTDEALESVLLGNDFFKFTFVRQPYSRILSCYLDRIKPRVSTPYKELCKYTGHEIGYDFSFLEFIEAICSQTVEQQNNHWRVQYYDTLSNIVDWDFVGKQESFSQDMESVWKKIFLSRNVPNFSSINKSPSKNNASEYFNSFWDSKLIKMVNDKYELDFINFNYEMK